MQKIWIEKLIFNASNPMCVSHNNNGSDIIITYEAERMENRKTHSYKGVFVKAIYWTCSNDVIFIITISIQIWLRVIICWS